jgi:hypothetical protein
MKHTGEELERLLRSYLDPDDEHPDLDGVLFRYADGTLDPQQRAEVDAHLEHCARCREDLADAVAAQRSIERRRRPPAWLIAAALAAIVVAAALLRPRREPAMPPPAASVPAEWRALVQQARAQRRIDAPPAVRALQVERDILRDRSAPPVAGTFAPSGTVIETQQPDLHWPAKNNATYRVRIFEKEKEVARSPLLHENRWTPPRPLDRGATYVWQVEIADSGGTMILPAPPDPPALFTVLDAKTAATIEDARRRFPDDRLLLAVLYAHAGVRDRAEDEIGRWLAVHPEDAVARDLLTSIKKW